MQNECLRLQLILNLDSRGYEIWGVIEEAISGHDSESEEEFEESEIEVWDDENSADKWTETYHTQLISRFAVGKN